MSNKLKYCFDIYFKNGNKLAYANTDYNTAVDEIADLFVSFKNRSLHIFKCSTETDVADMSEAYKISYYPEPEDASDKSQNSLKLVKSESDKLYKDVMEKVKTKTSKFYNKLNGDDDIEDNSNCKAFPKTIPEECLKCKMLCKCQEKNIKMCE